jgi:hypothetical protein
MHMRACCVDCHAAGLCYHLHRKPIITITVVLHHLWSVYWFFLAQYKLSYIFIDIITISMGQIIS